MSSYEGIFILKAENTEGREKEILGGIESEISKFSGQVTATTKMPQKSIAYEIKKTKQGVFYQLDFDIEGSHIEKLNRSFQLNNDLLRAMIVAKNKK